MESEVYVTWRGGVKVVYGVELVYRQGERVAKRGQPSAFDVTGEARGGGVTE